MIKEEIYQTKDMFTIEQFISILLKGKMQASEDNFAWTYSYMDGVVTMYEHVILGYTYTCDEEGHGDIYAMLIQKLTEVQNKHKLLTEEGIYLYKTDAAGYSLTATNVRALNIETFLKEGLTMLPLGEYAYQDYTDSGGGVSIVPIEELKVQVICGHKK